MVILVVDVRCVLLLHPVTAVLCTMIGLVVQVFMDVRSPQLFCARSLVWKPGAMAGSWSDSDEDAVTADKSGEILLEVLTGLQHIGKLSAKDVCIIGWWAAQAGAVGPVRALAKSSW